MRHTYVQCIRKAPLAELLLCCTPLPQSPLSASRSSCTHVTVITIYRLSVLLLG
jgi:hypothetical protein